MVKKKKRKNTTTRQKKQGTTYASSDFGPEEKEQHDEYKIISEKGVRKMYNKSQRRTAPLVYMYNRGQISESMFRAGNKVSTLWSDAGGPPVRALNPFSIRVDGSHTGEHMTEFQVRKRQELDRYLSVLDPYGRCVVLDVCCYAIYASDLQKLAGKPRYFVSQFLKQCLNVLAYHGGFLDHEEWQKLFMRPVLSQKEERTQ